MQTQYSNKTYPIELEVVSPLHIGGATEKRWQEGTDFLKDSFQVHVFNAEKLIEAIGFDKIDLVSEAITRRDTGEIKKLFGKKPLKQLAEVSFSTTGWTPSREILALIRDGNGKTYVPGSSLKGAIRSVIFKHLKANNLLPYGATSESLQQTLFGDIDNNLMRFLRIGDAYPGEVKTEIKRAKIFNLFKPDGSNEYFAGWKHDKNYTNTQFKGKENNFSSTYEYFPVQSKMQLDIQFADGLGKWLSEIGRGNVTNYGRLFPANSNPLTHLFTLINQHTKDYLDKQIAFLKVYEGKAQKCNEISQLIRCYEQLKQQLPTDNQNCLLRMAAGSGFHSITGDWRYDDYDKTGLWQKEDGRRNDIGKKKVKSRKFLFEQQGGGYAFYPMGFVRLRLVNKDEVAAEAERSSMPQFTTGRIGVGSQVEGITYDQGPQKTFTLYLNEPETQQLKKNYNSDVIVGKPCVLRIKRIQNGIVKEIDIVRVKLTP